MYRPIDIKEVMASFVSNAREEVNRYHHPTENVGPLCIAQALLHLSDSIRHLAYKLGLDDVTSTGTVELGSESVKVVEAIQNNNA